MQEKPAKISFKMGGGGGGDDQWVQVECIVVVAGTDADVERMNGPELLRIDERSIPTPYLFAKVVCGEIKEMATKTPIERIVVAAPEYPDEENWEVTAICLLQGIVGWRMGFTRETTRIQTVILKVASDNLFYTIWGVLRSKRFLAEDPFLDDEDEVYEEEA